MRHTGTQTLTTPRLVLRRFKASDAKPIYETWANDPAVTRWLRWEPHPNVKETRAVLKGWLDGYKEMDYYHWAITLRQDGTLIGGIGILPSIEDNGPDGFEPGYCIGRAFWGQGYTTEALAASLDYFIPATGVQKLYCCHATGNPASGKVMQKAGFVYHHDGSYTRFNGTKVEAKYYELDCKNYRSPAE